MKNNIYTHSILTLLTLSNLSAKEAIESVEIVEPASGKQWLEYSLNARLRYESRNRQGSEQSHATTLRVRPGIQFNITDKLNLFAESEHTLALTRDFQAGTPQSSRFTPFKANNTDIADPETNELNRLQLQYKDEHFGAVIGRQRLIFDQAQFIGNVGWRQNEQTFDAVKLNYSNDSIKLTYAYVDQVNRIFGSDATGPVEALEGNVHLFNFQYKHSEDHNSTFYTYLMDFSDQAAGFPTNASNNTFGVKTDLKTSYGTYKLDFAYQTEAGDKADYDAIYSAASFHKKVGSQTLFMGVERLEDGFVTPLATVHAYNGYADAFINNRLGLVNNWDGLTDFYVGVSKTIGDGYKVKGTVHYFSDDSVSQSYGHELDLVVSKKLADPLKATAKTAYFFGKDGTPFGNDIAQLSVQLDYSF